MLIWILGSPFHERLSLFRIWLWRCFKVRGQQLSGMEYVSKGNGCRRTMLRRGSLKTGRRWHRGRLRARIVLGIGDLVQRAGSHVWRRQSTPRRRANLGSAQGLVTRGGTSVNKVATSSNAARTGAMRQANTHRIFQMMVHDVTINNTLAGQDEVEEVD